MASAWKVSINVHIGGWPVWCTINIDGVEKIISDTALSDLIYAARKAQEEANEERRKLNQPLLSA